VASEILTTERGLEKRICRIWGDARLAAYSARGAGIAGVTRTWTAFCDEAGWVDGVIECGLGAVLVLRSSFCSYAGKNASSVDAREKAKEAGTVRELWI
jgi:hypothetical protein